MKIFIASDIHGSSFYCKKMVERFVEEKADKMLLLGDILYHGPRNDLPKGYNPKEVIAMLNPLSEKIICVKGNCDAEVDQMVLNFTISETDLIIEEGGRKIYATHGHHVNLENLPKLEKKFVLLNGHTHVSKLQDTENFFFINPGSISIPKENTEHSYVILENNMATLKNLDGKILQVAKFDF